MFDNSLTNTKNCPHFNINSGVFNFILDESKNFYIICDANPVLEGHLLIIPKNHISCIGEYDEELFSEFLTIDKKVSEFLVKTYCKLISFEHGVFGQTVFHSHIHYLPADLSIKQIIPEENKTSEIESLKILKNLFERDGGYLYISIDNKKWTVDTSIAHPRFFRDRLANALGKPERGNWKEMVKNKQILNEIIAENNETKNKWRIFDK